MPPTNGVPPVNGRRPLGGLLMEVVAVLHREPHLSDLAVGATLGVSEQAVERARRTLLIPAAYQRRRKGAEIDSGLGRCSRCPPDRARWISLDPGVRRIDCAVCGGPIYLTSVRLRYAS